MVESSEAELGHPEFAGPIPNGESHNENGNEEE